MNIENIGNNLKRIREEWKLSILDVAVEVGYSESHIEQIERGARKPSLTCLLDLMDFYCCDANAVFGTTVNGVGMIGKGDSIEERIASLPFKDREKATRIMNAVLCTFEGKEVD